MADEEAAAPAVLLVRRFAALLRLVVTVMVAK
jgi:hypothetical protein